MLPNIGKLEKPYAGFPLTAHSSGVWCKKIRGKLHYFDGLGFRRLSSNQCFRDSVQRHAPGVADFIPGAKTSSSQTTPPGRERLQK